MFRKEELLGRVFLGVVESIDIDGNGIKGKKKGRAKIRIERLHGKKDDTNNIPTQDIPWANPTLDGGGFSFFAPSVDKIVRVIFIDGDYYNPVYTSSEHYNFNLQDKLQTLTDKQYKDFYAITFDDKHQYYHDVDKGVIIDYVKTNLNLTTDGNMALNLRDNKAKLFLGTDNASERIVLGEKFFKWFDSLVNNLMGATGGPYLGNLGAPVIPNPGLLQCLNEYLSNRSTDFFLSDNVYVVDDKQVKAQSRKFDKAQTGDNWTNLYSDKRKIPVVTGYNPEEKKPSAEVPDGVSSTVIGKNLSNSKLPQNPTNDEIAKTLKPFDGYSNGQLDVNRLTVSRYAQMSFPNGEQQYLLDDVATSVDKWLDDYNAHKEDGWNNVKIIKSYQNLERQQNIRAQLGTSAPEPGKDPFGFANQVELYWNVNLTDSSETDPLITYLDDKVVTDNINVQTLDWLINNGKKYKWRLAGRNGDGKQQFSHWIYDTTILPV